MMNGVENGQVALGGAILQERARSLARACELGRIGSNGQPAKAAREVRTGDMLQVKNDTGDFRWRCWRSAKCAAQRSLRKRSTVKRRRAGNRG